MRYNQLGHTDIKVSAISLGCEGFVGKTPEETKEMIDFAISSGINFIDLYSPNPICGEICAMRSERAASNSSFKGIYALRGSMDNTCAHGILKR
jgi:aryl-alcohol dehydrogenase-like predicted oxidoreductase